MPPPRNLPLVPLTTSFATNGHPTKQAIREEMATLQEIARSEREASKQVIKADIEFERNERIVTRATETEIDYFDDQLPKIRHSRTKQELVSDRLAVLKALNDITVARHAR